MWPTSSAVLVNRWPFLPSYRRCPPLCAPCRSASEPRRWFGHAGESSLQFLGLPRLTLADHLVRPVGSGPPLPASPSRGLKLHELGAWQAFAISLSLVRHLCGQGLAQLRLAAGQQSRCRRGRSGGSQRPRPQRTSGTPEAEPGDAGEDEGRGRRQVGWGSRRPGDDGGKSPGQLQAPSSAGGRNARRRRWQLLPAGRADVGVLSSRRRAAAPASP